MHGIASVLLGQSYHAWAQHLLRDIADAATQTWHAHGPASLQGRESGRTDLRLTSRPDGAKPHPEAGWASIALPENSNKSRAARHYRISNAVLSVVIETGVITIEGPATSSGHRNPTRQIPDVQKA